jgi:phosphoribosylformylglycinamidine (FGAM) synthase-like enzyme
VKIIYLLFLFHRLGGSSLAQCYKQLGDTPADLDDPVVLKSLFKVTQKLLKGNIPNNIFNMPRVVSGTK